LSPAGADLTSHDGRTPSGSRYLITVPQNWNEALLLYCRGLPVDPDDPPWSPDDPLFEALSHAGYAIAGSGGSIFWPLEQAFQNQAAVLDEFVRVAAQPRHTIAWGYSIGGIIAAGLVERIPDRLSGALPLCGNLAGAVAIHNRELDIAFVIKTLLAAERPLQIAKIDDPGPNLQLAQVLLQRAQDDPAGRARLALAAAIGNIPGWFDPGEAEPAPGDFRSRQLNQFRWYEEPVLLVLFFLRAQVERQAGGNPSWNSGVSYDDLLRTSINHDAVESLYEEARVDLAADLATLAAAPRIEADPSAAAYLERNIIFSGDLRNVPVLALHTEGDGLVTPDNEQAYADVVSSAGHSAMLRQLYLHRGGHCSFTIAELLTGVERLMMRVDTGIWPALDPSALNDATAASDPALDVLIRDGRSASAAFARFEPSAFPRPFDTRSVSGR
jgi:pimeloyl-ACP methyl ester carboxylesterase